MKKRFSFLISTSVGKFLLTALSLLLLAGIGISMGALLLVHSPIVKSAPRSFTYLADTIQQTLVPGEVAVKVTLVEFHISSTVWRNSIIPKERERDMC